MYPFITIGLLNSKHAKRTKTKWQHWTVCGLQGLQLRNCGKAWRGEPTTHSLSLCKAHFLGLPSIIQRSGVRKSVPPRYCVRREWAVVRIHVCVLLYCTALVESVESDRASLAIIGKKVSFLVSQSVSTLLPSLPPHLFFFLPSSDLCVLRTFCTIGQKIHSAFLSHVAFLKPLFIYFCLTWS